MNEVLLKFIFDKVNDHITHTSIYCEITLFKTRGRFYIYTSDEIADQILSRSKIGRLFLDQDQSSNSLFKWNSADVIYSTEEPHIIFTSGNAPFEITKMFNKLDLETKEELELWWRLQ